MLRRRTFRAGYQIRPELSLKFDYRAAMPLKPTVFGSPSISRSGLTVPSELMSKTLIAPDPESRVNRYLPSLPTVTSRLVVPWRNVLTIVLATGVSDPFAATVKPATLDV